MFRKIFIPIIFSSIFTSCSDIYRNFEKTENMKWYKSDKKSFTVDIKSDGNYDLIFAFRYATLYPYKNIKVLITKKTPGGQEFTKEAEFAVVDEENNYLGQAGGDIWDLENDFAKNEFLEKGIYKFTFEQNMQTDPVIVVMEVGLIVRKSKK